jgi:hypothetical protein
MHPVEPTLPSNALPPEVRPVVDRLLAEVKAALEPNFVGLYLYGSLAIGDFNLQQSDLDFLVVTADRLTDEAVGKLREMHARIEAAIPAWATPSKVEGWYMPRLSLRRYDPADGLHPHYAAGAGLRVEEQACDWVIQRFVLHEYGVVIAGPDPRTLIDPVTPSDLRYAVWDLLRVWWLPMVEEPGPLLRRGYQAYTVLTLCRMLYTQKTGEITSKPRAVSWALRSLDATWVPLIRAAAAWRRDTDFDHLAETQRFIAFTWERLNT